MYEIKFTNNSLLLVLYKKAYCTKNKNKQKSMGKIKRKEKKK